MDTTYYRRRDGEIFRYFTVCIFEDDAIFLVGIVGPLKPMSRGGVVCLEPQTDEVHYEPLFTMGSAFEKVDVAIGADGSVVTYNPCAFEPGDFL